MFVWNSSQSPSAKWPFEAKIVPLLLFCDETRTVTPFFTCVFHLLWLHKKFIIIRGKVEVVFFGYEWLEFPHLEPQRSKRYCENCPSLSFFTTSGNLRLSNLQCKAQKIKNRLKVLVRFILYFSLWNKNFWQLFEFWKFHVQLGKNTQNYKHKGQKQASRPHLFFYSFWMCYIWLTFVPSLKKKLDSIS